MGKGLSDLYDKFCSDLGESKFIDWIFDSPTNFAPGMLCYTVALYLKKHQWYLEEAKYDPYDEDKSTWYAKKYSGSYSSPNSQNIMKYFSLEKDERLITTNGKIRPVVLIKGHTDSWANPANAAAHEKYWLCVPLFSYKNRHSQEYVLEEQRLKNPTAFYIPSWYKSNPGPDFESSARFQAIQMVKEEHLKPLKRMCTVREPQMNRPFGLTKTGLEIMMYHFYDQFNIFPELTEACTLYSLFKEAVNNAIDTVQ